MHTRIFWSARSFAASRSGITGGKGGSGNPPFFGGFGLRLKKQLQGELNLPRRTEVTHGEAGAENFAERGAGDRVGGVVEVGVIEKVEHLGAELQVEPFGDFRVLDDGEVGVDEVRTGKRIASGVSGMATAGDDWVCAAARRGRSAAKCARNFIGGVRHRGAVRNCGCAARRRRSERLAKQSVAVKLCGTPGAGNGPELIRPDRERRAGRRTNRQKRCNRIATLGHGNYADLPSGNEAIAFEGELIEAADDDAVAHVEFRGAVIAARIVNILQGNGVAGTDRAVIERMGIRVGGEKLETVG